MNQSASDFRARIAKLSSSINNSSSILYISNASSNVMKSAIEQPTQAILCWINTGMVSGQRSKTSEMVILIESDGLFDCKLHPPQRNILFTPIYYI